MASCQMGFPRSVGGSASLGREEHVACPLWIASKGQAPCTRVSLSGAECREQLQGGRHLASRLPWATH